jgi:hypothetical protein
LPERLNTRPHHGRCARASSSSRRSARRFSSSVSLSTMRSFSAFSDTISARNCANCVGDSTAGRSRLVPVPCVCSSIFNSTLDRLSYRRSRALLIVGSADDVRFIPSFADVLADHLFASACCGEGIIHHAVIWELRSVQFRLSGTVKPQTGGWGFSDLASHAIQLGGWLPSG